MTATPSRTSLAALRSVASAALLALAGTLSSGPAAAASAGDTYTLTLTYTSEVLGPSVGSFVLGAEVAGHPGVFAVAGFGVVIGPVPNDWNYDLTPSELDYDANTGWFGGAGNPSHAFTSYGDQLDLGEVTWKTDDFIDPHCDQNGCADFHYGTYVASLSAVPEPGSLGMGVAGLAIVAAWARRRRAS